jgi:curli biogenesis system outer membrane secretion channel CsgG
MSNTASMKIAAISAALLLAGCVSSPVKMGSEGGASTVATGGAAGASASNENSQLEKCAESLGTVSLVENQSAGWYGVLTGQYKLPPTANLLRLLVQQSNCFVVVERSGAGMQAMRRERALEDSGEMRAGSKFQKGQMVASDYAMTPEVIFSEGNTGGLGGAVGGIVGGPAGRVLSTVGAGTKTREAAAMLTLVDNRSGVQIAASEGSASKTDWGGFVGLFGSRAGGTLGGYTNTPQGKVIAGAFMDAYNQMVRSLRNYKAQQVKGGLGKGGQLKVGD